MTEVMVCTHSPLLKAGCVQAIPLLATLFSNACDSVMCLTAYKTRDLSKFLGRVTPPSTCTHLSHVPPTVLYSVVTHWTWRFINWYIVQFQLSERCLLFFVRRQPAQLYFTRRNRAQSTSFSFSSLERQIEKGCEEK